MNNGEIMSMRHLRQLRFATTLVTIVSTILALFHPGLANISIALAAAPLTVSSLTWNVVGLDSNNVNVGPNDFPVGARVCNQSGAPLTNVKADFVWDSNDSYIELRAGSLSSVTMSSIADRDCANYYFEVLVQRNSAAYNHTRSYHINVSSTEYAGPFSTPTPREIFVEHLVSQNRNSVQDILWKQTDQVTYNSSITTPIDLDVGGTYDIKLLASTATQGYNQLESFITLSNTYFRVNWVASTYSANTLYTLPATSYDKLYADSCGWDDNPLSATYRSCIVNDNKSGGTLTVNFNITVLSGGGSNVLLNSMVYDFSGSSFHYNSDYSTSARVVTVVSPADFSKAFSPSSISAGGTSTLTFTLSNPTSTSVSGVSYNDPLPSGVVVSSTPAYNNTCGATFSPAAGATSLNFSGGTIPANSSCMAQVNVTATSDGAYSNTTDHLLINGADTGLSANAILTVFTASSGHQTCGPVTLATWAMNDTANPPTASALSGISASQAAGSGISPTIDTSIGNPANSWAAIGFSTANSLTLSNNDYFEFAATTAGYSSIGFKFDARVDTNLHGPRTLALYSSTDGTNFTSYGSVIAPTAAFVNYNQSFTNPANTSGKTYFRIYGYNAGNNGADADLYLDNIVISGSACYTPQPPTLTKAFSPAAIGENGTSRLTFAITNPNSISLTQAAFSDTLPGGILISASPNLSNTCGGSLSAGGSSISLTGATIPTSGCTIALDVISSTAGSYLNTTGQISSYESGTNTSANGTGSAALTVLKLPAIQKSFSPNPIYAGGISTLTFTLSNANAIALSGAAFTDPLPNGMVVASPANASTNCAGATFAPAAGASSLVFSGGTIPTNGSCTLKVDVIAASTGSYKNDGAAYNLTISSVAGMSVSGATDTLEVIAHYPGLKLYKEVSKSVSGPWSSFTTVTPGSPLYYRLTIENTGDVDLSNVKISDLDLSLAGCPLTAPFTLYNAVSHSDPVAYPSSVSCIVQVVSAVSGDTVNTASASGVYNNQVYSSTNSADYLGVTSANAPDLTLIKQVSTSSVGPWVQTLDALAAGASVYYKFTVINSGDTTLSGLSITDPNVSTAGCQWIDPLDPQVATSCVLGPYAAAAGIHTNTATASGSYLYNSVPTRVTSPQSSATYTAGGYTLSGTVWEDQNKDGIIGALEPRLFDVTLNLYRDNGDNVLGPGDTFLGSQYTTSTGTYSFSNLVAGTYLLVVANGVSGYTLVSGGADPRVVVLSGSSANNDFGYQYQTDLSITKDDGQQAFLAGSSLIYTITAKNEGPNPVTGAAVTDILPSGLSSVTWTCAAGSNASCTASGSGDINDQSVNLLPGASVVYTVHATVSITPPASISNTATVAVPAAMSDTNSSNNAATDTDALSAIRVTVTPDQTPVAPGTTVTYTYTVVSAGTTSLTNVVLSDPDCSPINGPIGDANSNGILETTETWTYTCSAVRSQATTDHVSVSAINPDNASVTDTTQASVTVTSASGTISGAVWVDANGNGIHDSAETTGISGVTVQLFTDPNGDGSPSDGILADTQTTALDGSYTFRNVAAGHYVIVETDPAGFISTGDTQGINDNQIALTLSAGAALTGNDFLDAQPGSIKVNVWVDANGNGALDSGETTPLSGVTISLYTDPDGDGNPVDGQLVIVQTTGPDGSYTFVDLRPGNYVLVETDPNGYNSTGDSHGGTYPNHVPVTIASSQDSTGNYFLDAHPGSISGAAWVDTNGNGVHDSSETTGISGVTVQLFTDPNGDGNPTDGVLFASQTTASDGSYSFNNVAPGNYVIVETNLAGYVSSGDSTGPNDDRIPLALLSSGFSSGNDFLDFLPATISGAVWVDTNGNGIHDSTETTGISGVTVQLFTDPNGDGDPADGVVASNQTTASDGSYSFSNVNPGHYVIVETDPGGYSSTGDSVGANDNRIPLLIVSGDALSGNNFLDAQPGSISGMVWYDLNANGVHDSGEPGLAGVTVTLYDDPNGDGSITDSLHNYSTHTDATGSYAFTNLAAGYYVIIETDPAGFSSTADSAGANDNHIPLLLISNGSSTGNNFLDGLSSLIVGTDLSVLKTDNQTTVNAGGMTTYTIRAANNGPLSVTGAILTDTVLSGLSLTGASCTSAPGNQCGSTPLYTDLAGGLALPTLAPGAFYEINVTADVTAASGLASNKAAIAPPSGTSDPNPSNNESTDTDTINPIADLALTTSDGITTVTNGGTTTYVIHVINNGPSAVSGATLAIPSAAGLIPSAVVCSSAAGNQCSGPVDLTALTTTGLTLSDLAIGQFYEIRFTVQVSTSGTSVTHTATVSLPAGITDPTPANNTGSDTDSLLFRLFLPLVQNLVPVTTSWSLDLGYEDLPLVTGQNDFDYNDWNVAVNGSSTYVSAGSNLLQSLDMTFTPRARGGSYNHEFALAIPANAFASSGTATLTLFDGGHKVLSTTQSHFASGAAASYILFPQTADALPGFIVNSIEGQPLVQPQRFAKLSFTFDTPFAFAVNANSLALAHGEGLFFDPVLSVFNTGDEVHRGDIRLLSVPSTSWLWPEEGVRIDRAYPLVTFQPGIPPTITFPTNWWTQYNHCVYDGVRCGQ